MPGGSLGADGDSYVDTETGIVYQKTGGTWNPIAGSLRGPAGEDGADGAPGPGAEVGTTTPTGACSPEGLLHLNTTTG